MMIPNENKPHIDFTDPSEKLLTITDVCQLLSVSRSTLERIVKGNRFPPPSMHILKRPRWTLSVVNNWLNEQREDTARD